MPIAACQPTTDNVEQKFTGYQKDNETGLDFAEARIYENRHGRFTAIDPLLASGKSANPQTFNRYTYVLNSPLVNTDPTGLQTNQGAWYVRKRFDDFGNPKRVLYQFFENLDDQVPEAERSLWSVVDFGKGEYLQLDDMKSSDGNNLGTVFLKRGQNAVLTKDEFDSVVAGNEQNSIYGSFLTAKTGLLPDHRPSNFQSTRSPVLTNYPSADQCSAIRDLISEEAQNGSWSAAKRYSVTFGTQRRLALDNRIQGDLPDGEGGRIDQDWMMDLIVVSGSLPIRRPAADFNYVFGKSAWGLRSLVTGSPQTYYFPYSDPGERAALSNVNQRFRDVFGEAWFQKYCP